MTQTHGTGVVERPGSVAEAAELLRGSTGPVVFRGAGTKQAWAGRPDQAALVVETGGLAQVLAHNPSDMTVAVGAGLPLRDLQTLLGGAGQWLALDPDTEAAGATVGGLLATGDSGPRRLRYGALRDLVIGVTLVLSDGLVARGGGTVIKNVAGYDLPKLLYGSLGTLGLVAEVVLRLHPLPSASATVTAPVPIGPAVDLALRLRASALEPAAVDWADVDGGLLAVRFEGTEDGVAARRPAVLDLLGAGAGWHTGSAEDDVWLRLVGERRAEDGTTVVGAGSRPSATADVARALVQAGEASGVRTRFASQPALGLHTARFDGAPAAVGSAVTDWRERVQAQGGTVLLRDRPAAVDGGLDALGPPPSSVSLLRDLHRRLDPQGRCAPGRLGSWLPSPTAGEDSAT
ncbi:FAD-binding oxidoreductase [Modestobacter sp. VKM Ac-2985]|uniref:FAD-binding oxidoreductase n=1 Tax=Modestobacter sp. VKM Ac-2985 TaxID=3004139 RepID=UPI0022AB620E|nr:FAD-binding protein [Modestobacter sp. VKM Ac-2985]MCZ2840145.1 FAD-binding protein [Modestobacter sp. VKM Ac-2985]